MINLEQIKRGTALQINTNLLAINQHISITSDHHIEQVTIITLGNNVSATGNRAWLHHIHHILNGLGLQVIEHVVFLEEEER
jgi:hypothetical protein